MRFFILVVMFCFCTLAFARDPYCKSSLVKKNIEDVNDESKEYKEVAEKMLGLYSIFKKRMTAINSMANLNHKAQARADLLVALAAVNFDNGKLFNSNEDDKLKFPFELIGLEYNIQKLKADYRFRSMAKDRLFDFRETIYYHFKEKKGPLNKVFFEKDFEEKLKKGLVEAGKKAADNVGKIFSHTQVLINRLCNEDKNAEEILLALKENCLKYGTDGCKEDQAFLNAYLEGKKSVAQCESKDAISNLSRKVKDISHDIEPQSASGKSGEAR